MHSGQCYTCRSGHRAWTRAWSAAALGMQVGRQPPLLTLLLIITPLATASKALAWLV